jgi:hypothetical protein
LAIRDRLIDLEQRLKRLAGESEPREPLEIRQAIIRQVVDSTQPTGRGRRILPYDRVSVDVVAESAEARRVLEAVLQREDGLEAALRRALDGVACTPPTQFGVDVHYRKRRPADWTAEQRCVVSGRTNAPDSAGATLATSTRTVAPEGAPAVTVQLKVVRGRAARRSVEIAAERINIGRGEEVTDRDRRLVRRNDLAFVAGEESSDTVSRVHAHIRCSPSGECRLRDDGSARGTRIVRAGRTIDVAPGHTRGVKLQAGDELHLGSAIVRFDCVAAGAEP